MTSLDDKLKDLASKSCEGVLIGLRVASKYCECESEIEKLLFAAFLCRQMTTLMYLTMHVMHTTNVRDFDRAKELSRGYIENGIATIIIWPQIEVGPYRLDFLAFGKNHLDDLSGLVIECDGHNYHEKTKAQARRDKARDRFLLNQDLPVMRFTGSEIWRDASGCALDVLTYFETQLAKQVAA